MTGVIFQLFFIFGGHTIEKRTFFRVPPPPVKREISTRNENLVSWELTFFLLHSSYRENVYNFFELYAGRSVGHISDSFLDLCLKCMHIPIRTYGCMYVPDTCIPSSFLRTSLYFCISHFLSLLKMATNVKLVLTDGCTLYIFRTDSQLFSVLSD